MKKILSSIIIFTILFSITNVSQAAINDAIYSNEYAVYNKKEGTWSLEIPQKESTLVKKDKDKDLDTDKDKEKLEEKQRKAEEDKYLIKLTKKTSSGSGTTSIYTSKKHKLAVKMHSNYEFIHEGRLIAVDNSNLKYYELKYEDDQLKEIPLTKQQLSEIFDKAQIVKVSEFINNEYTTKKNFFSIKRILLVNDTDKSFYKYSYKPPRVQVTEIKGYIVTPKYEKIIFSHYGDKEGSLKININHK